MSLDIWHSGPWVGVLMCRAALPGGPDPIRSGFSMSLTGGLAAAQAALLALRSGARTQRQGGLLGAVQLIFTTQSNRRRCGIYTTPGDDKVDRDLSYATNRSAGDAIVMQRPVFMALSAPALNDTFLQRYFRSCQRHRHQDGPSEVPGKRAT